MVTAGVMVAWGCGSHDGGDDWRHGDGDVAMVEEGGVVVIKAGDRPEVAGNLPERRRKERRVKGGSMCARKRISEKRTKNEAKNDKTEQGMEEREKDKVKIKVKVKVNPKKVKGQSRNRRNT
ncbi:hypothetical protein Tco_0261045 [Tanacetum coccineum]